jgi:hypothetical protein
VEEYSFLYNERHTDKMKKSEDTQINYNKVRSWKKNNVENILHYNDYRLIINDRVTTGFTLCNSMTVHSTGSHVNPVAANKKVKLSL